MSLIKYILPALVFISCQDKKGSSNRPAEKLDTIKTLPLATTANPAILENAFTSGYQADGHNAKVSLTGIGIGKLKVPSGRMIACDPMLTEEYGKPFLENFPTGEFPVQLSIVNLDGVEAIAFARVLFNEGPVARWEFARLKGQDQFPIGGSRLHTYIVDGSLGSFMDSIAMRSLNATEDGSYQKAIYNEVEKHRYYSWKYGLINFKNNNIAAFSAGLGDGHYATYIGYDSSGKPCRLLTDFDLVKWRKED